MGPLALPQEVGPLALPQGAVQCCSVAPLSFPHLLTLLSSLLRLIGLSSIAKLAGDSCLGPAEIQFNFCDIVQYICTINSNPFNHYLLYRQNTFTETCLTAVALV